jgi:hypothetical protein
MRSVAWMVVLASGTATADDVTTGIRLREPRTWEQQQESLLHLDYVPPARSEGPGTITDRDTLILDLGSRVRIAAQGEWWKSSDTPQLLGPEIEDTARGWRAVYELSFDLGPFRVGGHLGRGRVDGRFQHGSYNTEGVSVSRAFRLSRWMNAWVSLGVERQTWMGKPPPGEANSTTIGLTIGTTFR